MVMQLFTLIFLLEQKVPNYFLICYQLAFFEWKRPQQADTKDTCKL